MSTTSVSVDERLGPLSKDQAELLKLLSEQHSRQAQKIRPYPRGDGAGNARLPASRAQQRLWFIDQLEGGSAAYHMAVAMRLRGVLDQEALQRALNTLVERHEVLRTVFVAAEGDPGQEIAADGRFALKVLDLSGYEDAEREAQVRLHKTEEARNRFDLRVGPLIRGRLLRVKAEEHVLLITMHHIISDGWSMEVFIRELVELYGAYREGRGDPLEPLPIQYADYAQWQRQWLQGEVLDKQLSYWLARLEGAAPQLELPTDRPRPPVQRYRGENVRVVLDAQLTAELRAFAQRHEMTLFMVLYAGWAILLSRLSGQDDVVIGTPIANRQRPELEGLIGFFVNTLVLRVGVRGALRMEEYLQRVKEVTLGAYDHQDMPFEQLVEALEPRRSLSRNPVFQVMFGLLNAPKNELRLPGLIVTLEDDVYESSTFDLLLSLEERGGEIVGSVNYATDLFDRDTVERWMACFMVLLRRMTDDVQSRIGDLPILPESERRQTIESFNATQVAYPHEKLIHQLFEQQVERTPAATAVVYDGQSLTYADLNGRANQLARYLRDKGVGPDQLVGICVLRGPEMLVGLLGILKAGGAYVPLDPNYPLERLARMLKDAAPKVLLTQERLRVRLPDTAAEVIALDNDWSEIAQQPSSNLDPGTLGLRSHHLAYVIYTSGSTGTPKGVMVEHAGLLNYLQWALCTYAPESGEAVPVSSSLAFDATVTSLYCSLLSGRSAVLLADGQELEGLEQLLKQPRRWSLIKISPAHLQVLGQRLQSAKLPCTVGAFVIGGEALPPSTVELWRSIWPQIRLINEYGPTETVVGCSVYDIPQNWAVASSVPIGCPISNTQIYILDRYQQPVPIGVVGEIHVGGVGVARGYLNRPELTAEQFLPDPFSADPQARVYKTGDLGRWHADGTIEYLGRNDHQVKIRGYRIELEEIESQLARHEQVKEAAVVAREDVPGEKRLVAYITRRDQSGPSVEGLRAHLRTVLPEYMVPGAFVILEGLPLTPSGKVDRRALPAPDLEAYVNRPYEAPQGEVEEILARSWQELLRVERVGRQDNFFDLGGHSLLATRVISRIRELLQVELPLRALFEAPTVEELSVRVEAEGHGRAARETLRMDNLAQDLRQEISEMHDDEVLARIVELERELERELAYTEKPRW